MKGYLKQALFIDKDGTLIENIPYNTDPQRIRLAAESEDLSLLQVLGFKVIVITNQPGVARGYFEEQALHGVRLRLEQLLHQRRIRLGGFYYCPHDPEGCVQDYAIACDCRKPAAGMILKALEENNDIDASQSWLLGDILDDIEAGRRAGVQTILIDNGNETEWNLNEWREPHYRVKTINEAVSIIRSKHALCLGAS